MALSHLLNNFLSMITREKMQFCEKLQCYMKKKKKSFTFLKNIIFPAEGWEGQELVAIREPC